MRHSIRRSDNREIHAVTAVREAGRPVAFAFLLVLAALFALGLQAVSAAPALAQLSNQEVPEENPVGGNVPGQSLGSSSDSEMWRAVREGVQGSVSIPDKKAGVLVQSEGDNWRAVRNGPVTVIGGSIILAFIALIALFFIIRGRVRIEAGKSGHTIERFDGLERFAHWLTAVSFILLAITGLLMLYGRNGIIPLVGHEIFAVLLTGGKYLHNYIAFAFMAGVVLIFVLWVKDNIPGRYDFNWLIKAGGLLSKHSHPPARKFNAGQKIIFWVVVLSGLSLSLSGWSLLFPFTTHFFGATFEFLNIFGLGLPENLTAMQEMQLSQVWHAVVALITIAIILGHIYIGTIGMEGAFDAMGSGQVDENWAKEHHSVWVAEKKGEGQRGPHHGSAQPAE